jgi:hypothetical protein
MQTETESKTHTESSPKPDSGIHPLAPLLRAFSLTSFCASKASNPQEFKSKYLDAVVEPAPEPFTTTRTKFSLLRKTKISEAERKRLATLDLSDRKAFHEAREAQIPASDAVKFSGWGHDYPSSLFLHYTGDPDRQYGDRTGSDMYYAHRGSHGEPLCRILLLASWNANRKPHVECKQVGTFVDRTHSWLSASPDGVVQFNSAEACGAHHSTFAKDPLVGGMELKFLGFPSPLETLIYGVNPAYVVQMQMQMKCAELPWVEFCLTWIAHDMSAPICLDKETRVQLVGHMVMVRVYKSESLIQNLLNRLERVYRALEQNSLAQCPKDREPELGTCNLVRYREVKFLLHPSESPPPSQVEAKLLFEQPRALDQMLSESASNDTFLQDLLSELESYPQNSTHFFGDAKTKQASHVVDTESCTLPDPIVYTEPIRKGQFSPSSCGIWLPSDLGSGAWSLTVVQQSFPDAPVHSLNMHQLSKSSQASVRRNVENWIKGKKAARDKEEETDYDVGL